MLKNMKKKVYVYKVLDSGKEIRLPLEPIGKAKIQKLHSELGTCLVEFIREE